MTDVLLLFGQVLAVSLGIGIAFVVVFGALLWLARMGAESAERREAEKGNGEPKHLSGWKNKEKGWN